MSSTSAFPATTEPEIHMDKLITVLRLLPAIVAAIKALEEALPVSGKGKDKLAALRTIMVNIDSGVTAIWPLVESVVATVVGLMNMGTKVPEVK
jgi:hypothetical protein